MIGDLIRKAYEAYPTRAKCEFGCYIYEHRNTPIEEVLNLQEAVIYDHISIVFEDRIYWMPDVDMEESVVEEYLKRIFMYEGEGLAGHFPPILVYTCHEVLQQFPSIKTISVGRQRLFAYQVLEDHLYLAIADNESSDNISKLVYDNDIALVDVPHLPWMDAISNQVHLYRSPCNLQWADVWRYPPLVGDVYNGEHLYYESDDSPYAFVTNIHGDWILTIPDMERLSDYVSEEAKIELSLFLSLRCPKKPRL